MKIEIDIPQELKEAVESNSQKIQKLETRINKLEKIIKYSEIDIEKLVRAEFNYPDAWNTLIYPTVWHVLWEDYSWIRKKSAPMPSEKAEHIVKNYLGSRFWKNPDDFFDSYCVHELGQALRQISIERLSNIVQQWIKLKEER